MIATDCVLLGIGLIVYSQASTPTNICAAHVFWFCSLFRGIDGQEYSGLKLVQPKTRPCTRANVQWNESRRDAYSPDRYSFDR